MVRVGQSGDRGGTGAACRGRGSRRDDRLALRATNPSETHQSPKPFNPPFGETEGALLLLRSVSDYLSCVTDMKRAQSPRLPDVSAELSALSCGLTQVPMGLPSLWLLVTSAAFSGTWLWVCVSFLGALTSPVASGSRTSLAVTQGSRYTRLRRDSQAAPFWFSLRSCASREAGRPAVSGPVGGLRNWGLGATVP